VATEVLEKELKLTVNARERIWSLLKKALPSLGSKSAEAIS
jgi:hypothetical protein